MHTARPIVEGSSSPPHGVLVPGHDTAPALGFVADAFSGVSSTAASAEAAL